MGVQDDFGGITEWVSLVCIQRHDIMLTARIFYFASSATTGLCPFFFLL